MKDCRRGYEGLQEGGGGAMKIAGGWGGAMKDCRRVGRGYEGLQ